ncbi:response regulator transcription factor [Halobacteriovorax sp. RZ-2]|uniref:response regulator transcription factor n=1 Tax=unclassified Halobacteriovorax TaxID=2639665 RepID=UPI003714D350
MKNYLLIDDDIRIYNLMKVYLNSDENLHYLESTEAVQQTLEENKIDIVIIDIHLEESDGLNYFVEQRDIFTKYNIPVFIISQNTDLVMKLKAFQFGVDDYIEKPFEPLELFARIRAKVQKNNKSSDTLSLGDLVFNLQSRTLVMKGQQGHEDILLSTLEFNLLLFFAKSPEVIHSREGLLDNVWGNKLDVTDRTIDHHISNLRKKVKSNSHFIRTHFNLGYSLSEYKK